MGAVRDTKKSKQRGTEMKRKPRTWVEHLPILSYERQTGTLQAWGAEEYLELAFGEKDKFGGSSGLAMAMVDHERIGTMYSCAAVIVEALRFMRANPALFREFVKENRQTFDLVELSVESVR